MTDNKECRRKIIERGDNAIPKSCPKCAHGPCVEPGYMTARDELISLLQSKRLARNKLAGDLKTVDAEIAALESVRDQIDRGMSVKAAMSASQ